MVRNSTDEALSKENGTGVSITVLKSFENVRLITEAEEQSAPGSLHVMQESLRWECTSDSPTHSAAFWTVDFVDINLHAISTDGSNGYPPSIYAQTGDDYKEVRMIPEESRLQELYDALCEGVVRNEDSASEDMGGLDTGEHTNE
ncbi:unnamed protein product [Agarophyton chilense]